MKGVVLADGAESRLLLLVEVTNNHLLPVGRVSMSWHPVWKLKEEVQRRSLLSPARSEWATRLALWVRASPSTATANWYLKRLKV